jgi:hypothetical protein
MIWLILYLFILPLSQSVQVPINSSVSLSSNLYKDLYVSSSSYCPNETINVTIEIENVGNKQTTFLLNETIYDQYGGFYDNRTWSNQQIIPLEKKRYYFLRNVSESDSAGIYNVYSKLTYEDKTLQSQATFRIKQKYGTLVSSPSFIEETVFPGDFITKDVYFWLLFPCYGANAALTKSGQISDWIYFSQNPIYLSPNTWNTTKVTIFVDLPWNTIPGDYTGNIIANINNEVNLYIPVTIHVQTTGIFDVQTEVLPQYKEVCKGSEVKAKVKILKVFPSETLDVNMTYMIESAGYKYDQRKEVIAVTDSLEKFVTLNIPSNAQEGIYTYYSILDVASENWRVNISSYDTFNVISCQQTAPPSSISGGGGTSFPLESEETKKLTIQLTRYKILGTLGSTSSFMVKVKNTGSSNLTRIKLDITGIPPEWFSTSPVKIDKLYSGEESDFIVFIKPVENAQESIYQIRVKAKNSVESNEEKALFILSKDEKSLALTLYKQAEELKKIAEKTLYLTCLNNSGIKNLVIEGNVLLDLGKKRIEKDDYKKSQEILLDAIDKYETAIQRADVSMKLRYEDLTFFVLPIFKENFNQAKNRMDDSYLNKDYESFCPSLSNVTKYINYSIALTIGLSIAFIYLISYAYRKYKEYRERNIEERLKEIKRRLE